MEKFLTSLINIDSTSGSIHNAHTPGEFISIEDMKSAVSTLTKIFHTLQNEIKNNELSKK